MRESTEFKNQRDGMRAAYRTSGNEVGAVALYAGFERDGRVTRRSDVRGITPEQYARALLHDGQRKGWL